MSIGKIISKGILTVMKSAKSEQKLLAGSGRSISEKASSILSAKPAKTVAELPVKGFVEFEKLSFRLKGDPNYSKLSDGTKNAIEKFGCMKSVAAIKYNNPKIYDITAGNIKRLVQYCDDEKAIQSLMNNEKKYKLYVINCIKCNEILKKAKYTTRDDYVKVLHNLAAMTAVNPESFRILTKSKGMKEIIAGRLNIGYLKNLKPSDKIEGDFFYNLFDKIEKSTNERLVKSGLDVDSVNKYLKFNDNQVCANPDFANSFITKLEKIDDPELANTILKKFEGNYNKKFMEYGIEPFNKFIEGAALEPKLAQKVLKIQNINPFSAFSLLNLMKDKSLYKVSDDLFESYLKFEKAHPDCCMPYTLRNINNFLWIKGTDEKLVKEIFENADKIKKSAGRYGVDEIFENANQGGNISFLKSCLKENNVTPENLFKYKILRLEKGQLSDKEISKLYNEIYKPLCDVLDTENKYFAGVITEMKLTKPENFAKIKESKILDLVIEKRISPRILKDYKAELSPEIAADIQKLLNGESLIKKFDTTKDILKKTKAGDVMSVHGKMYINNNGKLEKWNMTEEKFNELFPLVDRFSTIQGRDDCYLISALNNMYRNPHTRGAYYKIFEQKGNDICVTIPAYKDYKGEIRFPNGEIQVFDDNANAAKNVQMLERAYARTALRRDTNSFSINDNPLTTQDLGFLSERVRGGNIQYTMKELLPAAQVREITDKNGILNALNYSDNPKFILEEGFRWGKRGHARSVVSYSDEKGVTVIDPEIPGKMLLIPVKEFFENILNITVARIG